MKSSETPLVSILCLSYNQKDYIKQALDSFLMQKTNFLYEIIINDDASTDGTRGIIEEYARKYPNIQPVFHKENEYQKGKRNMIIRYLLPLVKGKYIALCDGDDFWTDETKLQKQVDFLEANVDYSLVFHPVKVFFEKGEREDMIFPDRKGNFDLKNLLEANFIQTNSVMYRAQDNYNDMNLGVMPGDWYLHLYHAQFGSIGFINRVMSTYRRHESGIWWATHSGEDDIWKKYGVEHLALYLEHLKMYGDNISYRKTIMDHIVGTIDIFLRIDRTYGTRLLSTSIKKHTAWHAILVEVISGTLSGVYADRELNLEKIQLLQESVSSLQNEIHEIKSSRRYRFAEKIAHVLHREK